MTKPLLLPAPRAISLRPKSRAGRSVRTSISQRGLRPEGYRIELTAKGVAISAYDEAGAFYAQQSLTQLRRVYGKQLPQGKITDWPDFPVRGVMLDISRDKVPTMSTLFKLVDFFAELKINQLQLYTEHTFAYAGHEDVWRDASPMTPREIRKLDVYCKERFIELVPNQNSFGHMERWLKHPRYQGLADMPDVFTFPWGTKHTGGFTINPLDPNSLALIEDLFDQLLPNFSSKFFNVGCDETFDLGLGKSKVECERRGKANVYLDFLLKIDAAVTRRGRTMQFWGDIVLHHPELISKLPKDLIALNWGYDGDHPFEKQTRAFVDAGVPFYVCPGTSSWLSISGRTDDAIANLKNAAASGLAHGAIGYLNTDWGDLGHLQYLPISYLGFAAGAAYGWCYKSNRNLHLPTALDLHVFHDSTGVMGQLMHDFGNVYQAAKRRQGNSSRLFWALIGTEDRRPLWEVITKEEFDDAERRLDAILARLDEHDMRHPEAKLIESEIRNAAAMLHLACRAGRGRIDPATADPKQIQRDRELIIRNHRRLWLARNRPGGLDDSISRLSEQT